MRKVIVSIVSLCMALSAFLALAGPTFAYGTLTVWEDANYGGYSGSFTTSLGDLTQTVCCHNERCNRYFPVGGGDAASWNDCISSFKYTGTNCHYGVSFYAQTWYVGLMFTAWGVTYYPQFTVIQNDSISSFKFVYRATCPLSATG